MARESIVFSTNGAEIIGHPHGKKKSTPFTKINSKWTIDLNVKYKTTELIDNNRKKNKKQSK